MPTPAAVSQVRRAVRSALLLETGRPARWRWAGQVPEDDFVAAVLRHRVAVLLAGAAESLELPEPVARRLGEVGSIDRLDAMAHVRSVATVAATLEGLDHLVLKGAALAVQLTGDPLARGPGDVDVLVDPADLEEALGRLRGAGWTVRDTHASDPASWMWRYQRWVAHELALESPLGAVDLHWRPEPTYDALPDFRMLWARREPARLGPVTVPTLNRADAFAHALRHAARDDWGSLRSLVDVSRLARDPAVWPERLDRLARTSLSVVDATVGLPEGVPEFRRNPAALPRAMSAQRRTVRFTRFPGDAALRYAGYCLAASRTPRDVAVALSHVVLPPLRVTHITDRDAASAIAHGLLVRSRPSAAWREVQR